MLIGNMFWWIVLGFILLLITVLSVRTWLQHLADRMHEAKQRFEPILAVREQYEPTEPPPFAETAADLCATVTQIEASLRNAPTRYTDVDILDNHPFSALRRLLQTVRKIAVLPKLLNDIEPHLSKGKRLCDEIQKKPQQTRDKCAALTERLSDIGEMAADLSKAGFQDPKFTAAREAVERLCGEVQKLDDLLQTLPSALFTQPSTIRLSSEHKQVIVSVEQRCGDLDKSVTVYEKIFETWKALDGQTQEHIKQVRQNLDKAETATKQMACCIKDLHIITDKTEKIRIRVERLENNYREPGVDQLADILNTAGQLSDESHAHAKSVSTYLTSLTKLRETIAQNQISLEDLCLRINALSAGPSPRVEPTRIAENLKRIAADQRDLGDPDDQRLLGELSRKVQFAEQIQKNLTTLTTELAGIETARGRIIELREWADSNIDPALLVNAGSLAEKIAPYDPANWSHELRVSMFATDTKELARERSKQLDPVFYALVIPDGKIVQLAIDSEKVLAKLCGFTKRYSAIESRLYEVEESRDQAEHMFNSTREALNHLTLDPRRWNDVEAVTTPLARLLDLRKQSRAIEQGLKNLRHGTIAEKHKHVKNWESNCYECGDQLQRALDSEVAMLVGRIQTVLKNLRDCGSFHNQDEVRYAPALQQAPATGQAEQELGSIIAQVNDLASRTQQLIDEAHVQMDALYLHTVEKTWACEIYDKDDRRKLTFTYDDFKRLRSQARESATILSYRQTVTNIECQGQQIMYR